MADTIYLRDEGGGVQAMDLPLHPAIEARVNKGELVRVANAAGDPWVEEAPSEVSPEAKAAHYAREAEALAAELDEARAALSAVAAERDEALARVAELEAAVAKPAKAAPAKAAKPAAS